MENNNSIMLLIIVAIVGVVGICTILFVSNHAYNEKYLSNNDLVGDARIVVVHSDSDCSDGVYDSQGQCNSPVIVPLLFGNTSQLWGINGELWDPKGILPDFSYAGYHEGEISIPTNPQTKNVKIDYGAAGDGVTDDTQEFQNAINDMKSGVLYVPAGTYKLSDRLLINKSNFVLRGAGPGLTILKFNESLQSLRASGRLTPIWFTGWIYGQGGLVWIGKTDPAEAIGSQVMATVSPAARGDRIITLSSTNGIIVGQYIIIEFNITNNSFKRYLYDLTPSAFVKNPPAGMFYRWPVKVDAVSGNTITLHQPLRTDIRTVWNPRIVTYTPSIEIGIEDIQLQFPNIPYAPNGHHTEPGFNGIAFWGCMNCWAKNVNIINSDNGFDINAMSKHVTMQNINILGRTTPDSLGLYGHHGISFNPNAVDSLLTDFFIDKDYMHEITVNHFANGNVIHNGIGTNVNLDFHMNAPFENLFSNLSMGNPLWGGLLNPYGSSGGAGEAHAASWNVFWNLKTNSGRVNCPQSYKDAYWAYNYSKDFPHSITVPALTARNDVWCFGEVINGPLIPEDLYQSQLNRRLGLGN